MLVMTESQLAAGRLTEALRLVREAISIATERQLKDRLATLKVRMATIISLQGEYERSRLVLEELGTAADSTTESRIALGRVYVALGDFERAKTYLQRAVTELAQRGEHSLAGAAQESLGELAYESGDSNAAKAGFQQASASGNQQLSDPAAILASCRLVSLEPRSAAGASAEPILSANVDRAARAGQRLVEARCRLELAALQVRQARYAAALQTLDKVSADPQINLGVELEALAHYWRSRALAGTGDRQGGDTEKSAVAVIVERVQNSLPEQYRPSFARRAGIRQLFN
jgi:tetratricopeptide (TPR) repeat protein